MKKFKALKIILSFILALIIFGTGFLLGLDFTYKFKRYEDSSLSYTGIDKHKGEAVGGYDTAVSYTHLDVYKRQPLPPLQ